LPPAAAPVLPIDLWCGAAGLIRPGRALARLQQELAEALGVEHVFLVSSGRAALTLILRALHRLSRRRRVIVPAYTCFSVPAAIVKAGLEVVPCDIDPLTLDFDHEQLGHLVSTSDALAVVPTHLFGFAADVARARASAAPYGTYVVEDAAQSFGASASGRPLGTLGDVGFFSFGRGKTITCGNGGVVVTNSTEIGRELAAEYAMLPRPDLLRSLVNVVEVMAVAVLQRPALYWVPASIPFLGLGETVYSTAFTVEQLGGAQAGLLRHWRARLEQLDRARALRAGALRPFVPRAAALDGRPCVRLPLVCACRAERDRLYEVARRERLGFSLMYPGAINTIPELRARLNGTAYPVAESLAERLLTVPVHPLVSDADRKAIERVLQSCAEPA
jgi:perosamine synthetase